MLVWKNIAFPANEYLEFFNIWSSLKVSNNNEWNQTNHTLFEHASSSYLWKQLCLFHYEYATNNESPFPNL